MMPRWRRRWSGMITSTKSNFVLVVPQREEEEQQQRWDNLLRVLATREKLEKVHFSGS